VLSLRAEVAKRGEFNLFGEYYGFGKENSSCMKMISDSGRVFSVGRKVNSVIGISIFVPGEAVSVHRKVISVPARVICVPS
jgi:hypothetical protein